MKTSPANRGRPLEALILKSGGAVVALSKMPDACRRIGGGKLIPAKALVDFVGTVTGTGRAFFADAKRCDLVTRFPVGNRDHLPDHQRNFLIGHGHAGAVAGLVVERVRTGRLLWLDWPALNLVVSSIEWGSPLWFDLGPSDRDIDWRRIPGVSGGGHES